MSLEKYSVVLELDFQLLSLEIQSKIWNTTYQFSSIVMLILSPVRLFNASI